MTSVTPFKAMDLLNMNHVNLDTLTENFYTSFYFQYLAEWPTLCFKTEAPGFNSLASKFSSLSLSSSGPQSNATLLDTPLFTSNVNNGTVSPDICTGYMLGKVEGIGKEWHSHITAVTVAWDYRRIGLARYLVKELQERSEDSLYNCYFMDLFVRSTNALAINMYRGFGFDIFRRIKEYYMTDGLEPSEDAFGMSINFLQSFFFFFFSNLGPIVLTFHHCF